MAQGPLLMFLFGAVLCSISCVKVLPMDGTSVKLASEFSVSPSPVESQDFTTVSLVDNTVKETTALLHKPASPELNSEIPSDKAKIQYVVESQQYTIIPVTITLKPTPLLTPTLIEPDTVAEGMIDPTSVVKASTTETLEGPAVDLLPPKKS